MAASPREVIVRDLGRTAYGPVFEAMRSYTDARTPDSADELWLTEHEPVFTQGQAGKAEHVLAPGDIPVVQSDRGGQVTYHGPGQITGYLLFDIRRLGISIRELVRGIEAAVVALNVDMDLEPFSRINPCGLLGTPVTQLADLASPVEIGAVRQRLIEELAAVYGLTARRSDTPGPA